MTSSNCCIACIHQLNQLLVGLCITLLLFTNYTLCCFEIHAFFQHWANVYLLGYVILMLKYHIDICEPVNVLNCTFLLLHGILIAVASVVSSLFFFQTLAWHCNFFYLHQSHGKLLKIDCDLYCISVVKQLDYIISTESNWSDCLIL